MNEAYADASRALMLDGNAAAGILAEVFGGEMTDQTAQCASCGNTGEVGTLLAFMQGPGVVLRCSICENVVLRMVRAPGTVYLDLRGAAVMGFEEK